MRVKSKELHDTEPVLVGGPVLVLFPFLDGAVRDPKPKYLSQLRHGQVHVDALLSEVFAQGFGVDWIPPQLPEMLGN